MMVVRFEGGANRTIKRGNHNVEFYRQDHQTQNRAPDPVALGGGGVKFGREFGHEVGERTSKMVPLVGVNLIAIIAYKAAQK